VPDPHLNVSLVAADRMVWSGEARMVTARTTDGDLGVLAGHAPLLGVLGNGEVLIRLDHGENIKAAVLGGFLSVADDVVSILAETAQLAEEIDVDQVQRRLAALRAQAAGALGDDRGDVLAQCEREEALLRVAGVAL
jgi:F-type H+-transporting ATPase subunit epsilon